MPCLNMQLFIFTSSLDIQLIEEYFWQNDQLLLDKHVMLCTYWWCNCFSTSM